MRSWGGSIAVGRREGRQEGKAVVAGVKDRTTNQVRAQVIPRADGATLVPFVRDRLAPGGMLYTDDHAGYQGFRRHRVVRHSLGEYVIGEAHTNGIESFWSMFKRGYHGTYHQMSPKHLDRYAAEFTGRNNARPLDTIDQMRAIVQGMVGKRLKYRGLIA